MSVTKGPRICPSCNKPGKLLPVERNGGNLVFRRYYCQSCYWTGTTFRFIKKQSRPAYYLTLFFFLSVVTAIILGLVELLTFLPD